MLGLAPPYMLCLILDTSTEGFKEIRQKQCLGLHMGRSILDDMAAIAKLDRQNMLRILEETPQAYEEAYTSALKSERLPQSEARAPSHLALVGMGGSAIAADILRDWLFESQTLIDVIRGSVLPGSITAGTHVLVASYSGQTAEALSALKEARRRKTRIACITSGGEMLKVCQENGIPHVQVRTGFQPRAALPHLLSASLAILGMWGMYSLENVQAEIGTVVEQLSASRKKIGSSCRSEVNPAKRLAAQLRGTIPFVYTPLLLAAAGRRFKNQLNENSKVVAKYDVLPEMLHNEVQGWRMLKENRLAAITSFVFLRGCEIENEATQFEHLRRLIRRASGKSPYEISLRSPTRLATILATIYYCDYVSFYLAILRGVDPTPIETIQSLKRTISSSQS